ncbi:MAG: MFS transporter [Steroidobacteraceae bacterium]
MSAAAPRPRYPRRDLPLYLGTRTLARVAMLVQSVAVGWQVYALTSSPLALGIVGLVEFAPMFLLTLPAGELADRFDQRLILAASYGLEALSSGLLLAYSLLAPRQVWPLYGILVLFGCARGFSGPAGRSLLPFLVPPERLAQAIAWASSIGQVAVIAGPAAGGFAYAIGPGFAYGTCLVAFLAAVCGMLLLRGRRPEATAALAGRIERVKEGVRFVRSRPVVLGAISLDLFAVLLGGATALLPVYARDILHVGPTGLGLLRSAPAAGAAIVAVYLVCRPIERGIGTALFTAVGVFGVATIVFGFSTSFGLSLGALVVLGGSDQVSVYIRSALVQFATPDPMRGRVSAVSTLFISSSNELGEFESGVTAALIGTVPAVIVGGVGTLIVVALWMKMFPPLRTVERMTDVMPV